MRLLRSSDATVIVVDASVTAAALADDGAEGEGARARLRGEDLAAPALFDLEVLSVLRGRLRGGGLSEPRADLALELLEHLPVRRVPHRRLLRRCWELRNNVSPYDAAYVAAAEILGVGLLTGDQRLARSPGPRCAIEVLDAV